MAHPVYATLLLIIRQKIKRSALSRRLHRIFFFDYLEACNDLYIRGLRSRKEVLP